MNNKWISALVALLLLGGGATLVIVADRQGWLTRSSVEEAAQDCPHGMRVRECPFCDKALIEKMGFCSEHGVPEAVCTKCNPAVITAFRSAGDWCADHDVPESQCVICDPGLLADRAFAEQEKSLSTIAQLIRTPEAPRRQRAPSVTCQKHALRVQFLTPEIAGSVGLEYARIERHEVTQTLTCTAEVAYDGNRYAHLSSRAPGVVREVQADLGQRVEAGEVLAIVDSVDLGAAKAEHLQAQALVGLWQRNHVREQKLLKSSVATERDVFEAETKLTESRITLSRAAQRLRSLGLTGAQIRKVAEAQETSSLLSLAAPFAGVVVERAAVIGEVVDTAKPLFAIADTAWMWAILDVHEGDVLKVKIGQSVVLGVDGLRGERRGGRITWISSHVDRRTRTLRVRAEIANPDGLLRANMFGKAIVSIREREPVLIVPKSAVQWEGCCNVVFVKLNNSLFEPRKVRLGYETDRFYVVEEGLGEGEIVVTTGSFLLKTEILKGSIGAGCCPEVEPRT